MRYLGLLATYKEYMPITDQTPCAHADNGSKDIVIKSLHTEPLLVEDSEEAVMKIYSKLQGEAS